jgi:hypothetical protein
MNRLRPFPPEIILNHSLLIIISFGNYALRRFAQTTKPHLVKFFIIYSLPLFFARQNKCKSVRSVDEMRFLLAFKKDNINHARFAQTTKPHLVKFFVIYSLPLFFERQNPRDLWTKRS